MKMKKSLFSVLFLSIGFFAHAQTAEELKKEQAPKKAQVAKLKREIAALQLKIDVLPVIPSPKQYGRCKNGDVIFALSVVVEKELKIILADEI